VRGEVEISVVVPVFGCVECLGALHERLIQSLDSLGVPYELVLVDDRSPDGAWERLEELHAADPRVRAVRLSRNFGQHAAITAGVAEARGAWVAVMDCDLQDRPGDILRLYAEAKRGHDVVFARARAQSESSARRIASRLYGLVRRGLVRPRIEPGCSNLSIMSRKVVDEFLRVGDRHRSYQVVVAWLGFERSTIEVERSERYAGGSGYSLRGLARLAIDSLLFEPAALVRPLVAAGLALAGIGTVLAALAVAERLDSGAYPGWAGTAALALGTGAVLTATAGALYSSRVFEQVKGRPLYVVDERLPDPFAAAPGRTLHAAGTRRAG
jgi:dolichol-phosphate mannosyltransferase